MLHVRICSCINIFVYVACFVLWMIRHQVEMMNIMRARSRIMESSYIYSNVRVSLVTGVFGHTRVAQKGRSNAINKLDTFVRYIPTKPTHMTHCANAIMLCWFILPYHAGGPQSICVCVCVCAVCGVIYICMCKGRLPRHLRLTATPHTPGFGVLFLALLRLQSRQPARIGEQYINRTPLVVDQSPTANWFMVRAGVVVLVVVGDVVCAAIGHSGIYTLYTPLYTSACIMCHTLMHTSASMSWTTLLPWHADYWPLENTIRKYVYE